MQLVNNTKRRAQEPARCKNAWSDRGLKFEPWRWCECHGLGGSSEVGWCGLASAHLCVSHNARRLGLMGLSVV